MTEAADRSDVIACLIEQLASSDGVIREKSRSQLVQLGGPDVTRALVLTLLDPDSHVRWEAAKALQAIADPVTAPALMHALEDENGDVRWVAAEALISIGKVGLQTVLSGLITRAGSLAFRESARHVLREMKDYSHEVSGVLHALDHSEPGVTAPPAAHEALVALRNRRE